MSGVRPDVSRLSLGDGQYTSNPTVVGTDPHGDRFAPGRQPGAATPDSDFDPVDLPPNEPGPLWRLRNSTLGEQYASSKSQREAEAAHHNQRGPAASAPRSPASPASPVSPASPQNPAMQPTEQSPQHELPPAQQKQQQQHLKPADSSASVNSMASQRSSKSRSTPSSVVELKRFFGKGRKGDKADSSTSLKKNKKNDRGGLLGSLFHRHKGKHDKKKAGVFDLHGGGNDSGSSGSGGGAQHHDHVADPNLVVDDHDAWDPFHVFGEDGESALSNDAAERLPFLESGITKYGEMGKDMGSGAGGSVRMMERPSDHKLFAVKEFRARKPNETIQKYMKHVTAEYALGAAFHHEHIIETIDLIKEGDRYYEVMEYGPNDFFALVMSGSMTTPQVNSSFHQIVSGVHYLHSMGVAHRDLKLDNCVVTTSGVVKLIDFGSAVVFKYPMSPQIHLARGIMGSDPYLAPEVFERRPYQPQCADIWSCGIIYCCIYLRRFPWKLPQMDDVSYRKFAENPANTDGQHPHHNNPRKITGPWRILRLLPMNTRSILARILSVRVENRASMDEVLADSWFSSIKEISVLPPNSHKNPVSAPAGASQVAAHA